MSNDNNRIKKMENLYTSKEEINIMDHKTKTIRKQNLFKKGIDKIYFYLNKISLKNLADPTYNFTFYGPKESDEKKTNTSIKYNRSSYMEYE